MRFWDSSAIVALLLREKTSKRVRSLLSEDAGMVVWSLSEIEIAEAFWRLVRSGDLDERELATSEALLDRLTRSWHIVSDPLPVIRRARRIVALHPLRSADALQLAAALVACGERPEILPFVTLDERLADAANREGFTVVP